MKFYECKTCGNVIVMFEDMNIIPTCCGKTMTELVPQSEETEKKEKHIPVVERKEDEVIITVGETLHPMISEHYIKWIVLETNLGKYIRTLKPGCEPVTAFKLYKDEIPLVAYEFCNIHSLWNKQIQKEDF